MPTESQEYCICKPVQYEPTGAKISNSRGYPALCTFVSSDDNLFVVRRFEKLGARVILRMQDRIAYLEEELIEQDRLAREKNCDSGTFRYETLARRQQIMDEVSWRLKEYRKPIAYPMQAI